MSLVNFGPVGAPCRAEHPVLLELQEQGMTIYGVNIKDDPAQAIKYINDDGNPFAGIAFDPQGARRLIGALRPCLKPLSWMGMARPISPCRAIGWFRLFAAVFARLGTGPV